MAGRRESSGTNLICEWRVFIAFYRDSFHGGEPLRVELFNLGLAHLWFELCLIAGQS